MYSLYCNSGFMKASSVTYPVTQLSNQVLEFVCNLAHLIVIMIMSSCQKEVDFLCMLSFHDEVHDKSHVTLM
jgi:hypothetical protein